MRTARLAGDGALVLTAQLAGDGAPRTTDQRRWLPVRPRGGRAVAPLRDGRVPLRFSAMTRAIALLPGTVQPLHDVPLDSPRPLGRPARPDDAATSGLVSCVFRGYVIFNALAAEVYAVEALVSRAEPLNH